MPATKEYEKIISFFTINQFEEPMVPFVLEYGTRRVPDECITSVEENISTPVPADAMMGFSIFLITVSSLICG